MIKNFWFSLSHPSKVALASFTGSLVVVGAAFGLFQARTVSALGPTSTYTGCLKSSGGQGPLLGQLYGFAEGSSPANGCHTNDAEISLGSGDITSVTAGTGLTGGGTTGDVTLTLGSTYQLPQTCTTDQIIKWNGSSWVCTASPTVQQAITKDIFVSSGNTSDTTSTTPVSLPNASVTFTTGEITSTRKLLITWSGRFKNSTAGSGYGVSTHVLVDGVEVAETFLQQPGTDIWVQHAANRIVEATASAHTIEVKWHALGGGNATAADRYLNVVALP